MTDSERARHRLLARLREVLGDEEAATLMENLPPRPWSELATKDDLATLATKDDLATLATKDDLATLATKDDVAALASRIDGLAARMDGLVTTEDLASLAERMDGLSTTVDAIDADRHLLRRDLEHLGETLTVRLESHTSRTEALVRERVDAQSKLLMFSILGALLTTAAIAIGAGAL